MLSLALMATAICCLLSCATTKSSVSASVRSETVATSAHRLNSSLATDTINKWFTLSVDSMVMVLACQDYALVPLNKDGSMPAGWNSVPSRDADQGAASLDDLFYISCKPPAVNGSKSETDKKRSTAQQPKALKIYGLHVDAGTQAKSKLQSLAKDSTAETAQSSAAKGKEVRKTAPSQTPKYIFYILLLAFAIYIAYKIHKWRINKSSQ